MKSLQGLIFLLWLLLSTATLQAQNLLWEKTFGTPDREQQFLEGIDMGNDIQLFLGQNDDQYIHYPNVGGFQFRYWQLIDGLTGDTLRTRYWDPRYWGFPYPIAPDKTGYRIISLVRYINYLGQDSLFCFEAKSLDMDTLIWRTEADITLFKTSGRSRTMPAMGGGFIDCRQRNVPGGSKSQVMKFDSQGNLEWLRQYGPANHRCFTTWIEVTHDSCYIISGIQQPPTSSPDSAWCFLQKIDMQGNEIWRKTFLVDDTLPIKKAFLVTIRIEETPDYGYLINGSFATSQRGYSLNAKFDSTLTVLGRKWFMPSDSAIAYGRGYADGSCMLAGMGAEIPFSIRRTGPNGETIWKKTLTNPCRAANAVFFNSDTTAIFTGAQQNNGNCFFGNQASDFWWAKINGMGIPYNPLAVKEDVIPRAQRDEGMELYPNPAQEQITLKLPFFKGEKVLIFNHLGQKVLEERISGVRPQVSVQHLPSGLYRVRVGKWVKGFVKN